MKKLILSAFILLAIAGNSQENQLVHLNSLDPNVRLTKWRTHMKDGELKGSMNKTKCKLKIYSNVLGQKTSFDYIFETKDATDDSKGFPHRVKNHHTAPSYFYVENSESATLFLDGLYYEIELKDPNSPEKFEIEYIYVPIAKKEEGKKMSVKEKLAAAKAELKNVPMKEGDLPKFLKEKDHINLIKEYLVAMKAIQATATANFTAEEKAEIAQLEQAEKDRKEGIKKANNAYWASEDGQRKLAEMRREKGKPSKYTVVNTGSTPIDIGGNGWHETLTPGSTYEVNCVGDLYYKKLVGCCSWEDANLITKGSAACGKTIKL